MYFILKYVTGSLFQSQQKPTKDQVERYHCNGITKRLLELIYPYEDELQGKYVGRFSSYPD